MNNNHYAIIMAGGVGSRFWPLSTQENPKQFHDILGSGDTLIQKTFYRLIEFIPTENILILTNSRYLNLVQEQLPVLSREQIVLEPDMRNTGPCILYAALKIKKKNENAVMIVAPSDHWIEDEKTFEKNVKKAFGFSANNNVLMTLGIKPTFPNTGYGYIEYDKTIKESIKHVNQFREKPDYKTAKEFISQGNFLWNAGIFIWSVKSVIEAFEKNKPELYNLFYQGEDVYNTDFEDDFVRDNYGKAENVSVDYAIMEKSDNVYVLPAEFDWNDLGTWGSVYDKLSTSKEENVVINSKSIIDDGEGNFIRTNDNKIVAIEGLNNYVIVDEKEVLLIFPREKEQEIKELRERVGKKFGNKYI
ncbi:MAG: mannose-1-phosphate guanylyltransferase [Flavobacteriaceae bacterium]|nr:mannose-1-phosphate guanylyltransferase [Flavobacteriaceae bacterium]